MSGIGIKNYDDIFLHRSFKSKDLKSIDDIYHDLNAKSYRSGSHSWIEKLIGIDSKNISLDDNILISPMADKFKGLFRGVDSRLDFGKYSQNTKKNIRIQNKLKLALITQKLFRKWHGYNLIKSKRDLDKRLEKQKKIALIIQSLWRGAQNRKEFLKKKKLVLSLHKISRGYISRINANNQIKSSIILQALWRGKQGREKAFQEKNIQEQISFFMLDKLSAYKNRKEFLEKKKLALIMQKLSRGYLSRRNGILLDDSSQIAYAEKIAKIRLDARAKQLDNNQIAINKKTDLSAKEKAFQISLSGVSSFVGSILVFEGWLQLMSTLGIAGAGLTISNPLQIIPLALAGIVTGVSYLVNYWLYKAKIGDCFLKKDINNAQNQNQNQNQNIFQKFIKGLMLLSISIYTFAFFLASFQSEYLFGNFCKSFMDAAALKSDSFLQLLAATPVGLALSSVFLICAVLSAGCQFYFAASSIIKQSPGESLSKIKSYFGKMFSHGEDNNINKYKISDEDLHAKLNYKIYNLKNKNIDQNKSIESKVKDFRKIFSCLSLNHKIKLLIILEKIKSGNIVDIQDISATAISDKLFQLKQKTKIQIFIESAAKLISVSIFAVATVSLVMYLGPLVLAMFPALLAIKVVFGICCGSVFLARLPVGLESSFWAAERFAHIMYNMNESAFKWKYNKKKYLPGSYGMLYEKLSLNFLNAVANMAFAFFGAASGGMTYVFGASLFFLSFVITTKPCFEKKNLKVLGGVIQPNYKKIIDNMDNNQNIQTGFWSRFKDRLFGESNNQLDDNDNDNDNDISQESSSNINSELDSNIDSSAQQLAA